jgi:hypothetical protein
MVATQHVVANRNASKHSPSPVCIYQQSLLAERIVRHTDDPNSKNSSDDSFASSASLLLRSLSQAPPLTAAAVSRTAPRQSANFGVQIWWLQFRTKVTDGVRETGTGAIAREGYNGEIKGIMSSRG